MPGLPPREVATELSNLPQVVHMTPWLGHGLGLGSSVKLQGPYQGRDFDYPTSSGLRLPVSGWHGSRILPQPLRATSAAAPASDAAGSFGKALRGPNSGALWLKHAEPGGGIEQLQTIYLESQWQMTTGYTFFQVCAAVGFSSSRAHMLWQGGFPRRSLGSDVRPQRHKLKLLTHETTESACFHAGVSNNQGHPIWTQNHRIPHIEGPPKQDLPIYRNPHTCTMTLQSAKPARPWIGKLNKPKPETSRRRTIV